MVESSQVHGEAAVAYREVALTYDRCGSYLTAPYSDPLFATHPLPGACFAEP